ncbi:hypothetical protein [Microbacterium luticocti]|uniref:hypothetical protein n=1 Tax=Microbacterium luticocti TaxID=451764 RepID=UPI000407A567|nr:hypothetical protein [Microbacterium luticocti]
MDHRVELVRLGEGAWRLCDRSVPEHDAGSVLAYIEEGRFGVDVVWLCESHAPSRFPTLDDVVAAASRMLAGARSSGPRRPVMIPHHPPLPH